MIIRAHGKDLVFACVCGHPPRGPHSEGQASPRPCCVQQPVPDHGPCPLQAHAAPPSFQPLALG